jgi:hypothetical protein
VRILKTYDDQVIDWTWPAFQRWKAETFGAWRQEAYDGMIAALSVDGVLGNQTTSLAGQLATYEFLFLHGQRKMYGKIALRDDRIRILVLSAHRAQRETLSP